MKQFFDKWKFVLLVPIVPTALLFFNTKSDISAFEDNAPYVMTQGTVSQLDCQNHGHYQVTYQVNGIMLTAGAGRIALKGNCADLALNEGVEVWVSQRNNKFVSFIAPEFASSYMHSELHLGFLAYPLFAIFLGLATLFRRRDSKPL